LFYGLAFLLSLLIGATIIYGSVKQVYIYKTLTLQRVFVNDTISDGECAGVQAGTSRGGKSYTLSNRSTGKGYTLHCTITSLTSNQPIDVFASPHSSDAYLSKTEAISDIAYRSVFGVIILGIAVGFGVSLKRHTIKYPGK
jgi:hypothetical protein